MTSPGGAGTPELATRRRRLAGVGEERVDGVGKISARSPRCGDPSPPHSSASRGPGRRRFFAELRLLRSGDVANSVETSGSKYDLRFRVSWAGGADTKAPFYIRARTPRRSGPRSRRCARSLPRVDFLHEEGADEVGPQRQWEREKGGLGGLEGSSARACGDG